MYNVNKFSKENVQKHFDPKENSIESSYIPLILIYLYILK